MHEIASECVRLRLIASECIPHQVRLDSLSVHEIRCCRACNQGRLAALLGRLTRTLWELAAYDRTTLESRATTRRYLNALRIVSRLMPLLHEAADDGGVQHMLWTPLAVPPIPAAAEKLAMHLKERRCLVTLGGCLLHGVLAALFVGGFTSVKRADDEEPAAPAPAPAPAAAAPAAAPATSEDGAAPTLPAAPSTQNYWAISSEKMDEARSTCIEALLSCLSSTLYTSPNALAAHPNRMLTLTLHAPEPMGKALFRALVDAIFSYDPVGWGIPYSGSLLADSHGEVATQAAQLLVVLLTAPSPLSVLSEPKSAAGAPNAPTPPGKPAPLAQTKMVRLLGSLQRPETLAFLVSGFERLLGARLLAESTYLPSALAPVECEQEVLLLLWACLTHNADFGATLVASGARAEIALALANLVFAWAHEPASLSMAHLALLCLLRLSGELDFGGKVNQPCPRALPTRRPYAAVSSAGHLGDLLVGCAAAVVMTPPSLPLQTVYPAALALLANVAPHVKQWSAASAANLLAMLSALASPARLFASAAAPEHLIALLEVLTTSLQYTHASNTTLLHALLLHAPLLRSLMTISPPAPTAVAPAAEPSGTAAGDADADAAGSPPPPPPPPPPPVPTTEGAAAFVVTDEWLASWRRRLPLRSILSVLDYIQRLLPAEQLQASSPPAALQTISLAAVLPPHPPLAVHRYLPNEHSETWMTQVVWGVVYSRNQQLHDARAVRLVQIVRFEE